MFGRKKRGSVLRTIPGNRILGRDFMLRSSRLFESYTPPEYRLYPKMDEGVLRGKLDDHLSALFRVQGQLDDANWNVLCNTIFSVLREATAFYQEQKVCHEELIRRLAIRDRTDKLDFEKMIETAKSELRAMEDELADVNRKISAV